MPAPSGLQTKYASYTLDIMMLQVQGRQLDSCFNNLFEIKVEPLPEGVHSIWFDSVALVAVSSYISGFSIRLPTLSLDFYLASMGAMPGLGAHNAEVLMGRDS